MTRRQNRLRIAVALSLAFIVVSALAGREVLAHQPLLEESDTKGFDSALPIPRPEISHAIYARLESPDDVDFFSFEAGETFFLHTTIFLPCKPEFEDFYPVFAVVGPGLPSPESALPFDLPDGCGALVVESPPNRPRPTFFEPFTMTRLYAGMASLDTEFHNPGTYTIAVWHPTGEHGDYLVSFGKAEDWSLSDLARAYELVLRIKRGKWGGFRGHSLQHAAADGPLERRLRALEDQVAALKQEVAALRERLRVMERDFIYKHRNPL